MIEKIMKSKLPKIKEEFTTFILNPDEIQIRSGRWFGEAHLFFDKEKSGKLATFISFLDGRYSWKFLLRKIRKKDLRDFINLIEQLNRLDLLKPKKIGSKLFKHTSIAIIGNGELESNITEQMSKIGFRQLISLYNQNKVDITKEDKILTNLIKKHDVIIVANDYSSPYLYNLINEICLKNDKKWIIAGIDGEFGFITPIFVPYKTACYKCFELRLESNILEGYKEYLKIKNIRSSAPRLNKFFIPSLGIISSILVHRIITFLQEGYDILQGNSLFINLKTLTIDINNTLKLPRCPVCGKPSLRKPNEQIFLNISQLLGKDENEVKNNS